MLSYAHTDIYIREFFSFILRSSSIEAPQELDSWSVLKDRNILEYDSKHRSINLAPIYDEEEIVAGDEWRIIIEEMLQTSSAVIVLWTEQSKDRPWVKYELERSIELGKAIVVAIGTKPPAKSEDFQAIQFDERIQCTPGFRQRFNRLISGIQEIAAEDFSYGPQSSRIYVEYYRWDEDGINEQHGMTLSHFGLFSEEAPTLRMRAIPEGRCLVGAKPINEWGAEEFEMPRHHCEIVEPFLIMESPFTIGNFRWLCEEIGMPHTFHPDTLSAWQYFEDDEIFRCVNWIQAVSIADRLSEHFDCRYRLPSEVEWEYCARAGSGEPFWFGSGYEPNPNHAVYNWRWKYDAREGSNFKETRWTIKHPLHKAPKPVIGADSFSKERMNKKTKLCDFLGNVWEWVQDDFVTYRDLDAEKYSKRIKRNQSAVEESDSAEKVIKGGSFRSSPIKIRASSRGRADRNLNNETFGFRLVRDSQI